VLPARAHDLQPTQHTIMDKKKTRARDMILEEIIHRSVRS
jgi:hypothetical protein